MPRINLPLSGWSAALILTFALALPGWADPAQDGVPAAHDKARYDALRAHSPFSLATEAPPAAAPQASFAANWFVSGIGRIGDADFVTIKSRDQSQEFSLFGRENNNPNSPNSVTLVSVNWSDAVGKSTVILQKGTETARLEFNEAELRAVPPPPAGATAPPGRVPQPGQPLPNAAGSPRPLPGAGAVNAPIIPSSAPPAVRRRVVPIQPPH